MLAPQSIKHIRAKPSALSQHPSRLLARVILSTREGRAMQRVALSSYGRILYVYTQVDVGHVSSGARNLYSLAIYKPHAMHAS